MRLLEFYQRPPALLAAALLASVLLVSACGGGGSSDDGGGGNPSVPPTDPCAATGTIRTADFGCLSVQKYRQQHTTLAVRHRSRADFRNQWGLHAVRAHRAWAQIELVHGAGVEAGVGYIAGLIDDGLDTDHPVFAGKTVSEDIVHGRGAGTGRESSHGTIVASALAGRPSAAYAAEGAGPGVAPGADVALLAISFASSGSQYEPVSLAALGHADDYYANLFARAVNWSRGGRKIDFVNASWGVEGVIDQYGENQLRRNLNGTIAALAQAGSADKTVFVFAAGNAHDVPCNPADFPNHPDLCAGGRVLARSVEVFPGLPARIAELRGHVIGVVAVVPDEDGDGEHEIASFSNRCGIAAQWCIAAPGDRIKAAYFGPPCGSNPNCRAVSGSGPGTRGVATYVRGTSVAAPFVTGGLLVMKQMFRDQMTNAELVARLMATANKRGIYADSSIYGQGLMDLGAATEPVGGTTLTVGGRIDSPGSPVADTRFVPGGALGNGLAQALSGVEEAVAFDALGAPFWFPLGHFVGKASGPDLTARLHAFMAPERTGRTFGALHPGLVPLTGGAGTAGAAAPFRVGRLAAAPFGGVGHLALAGLGLTVDLPGAHGLGVAAFSTEGMRGLPPASGAALTWRLPQQPFTLIGGMVAERQTLLGSTASGAFGRIAGRSAFAGLDGEFRVGAWRLGAGAEIGTVKMAARGGMLAGVSPLTTSAFVLRARRVLGGRDAFTLSVGQPLRVEDGQARISIPVGRTKDGRVLRRSMSAGLEPTGRQIDLAAQWRRALDNGSEWRLGAGWIRQPGHNGAIDPELNVLAGWRQAF